MIELSEVMSVPTNTSDPTSDTITLPQEIASHHSLSKDTIFHVLQAQRRRLTLQYLQDRTDTVALRDLADQVAAWENETTVEQLSSAERQRVYISLYQTHLPKLDTEEIIKYDKNRGEVQRTPRADQLDPYLSKIAQHHVSTTSEERTTESCALNHRRWARYYFGGTLFSICLLGAKLLHLLLVSQLASRLIPPVILLVFTIITAGHHCTHSALPDFDSNGKSTSSFIRQGPK